MTSLRNFIKRPDSLEMRLASCERSATWLMLTVICSTVAASCRRPPHSGCVDAVATCVEVEDISLAAAATDDCRAGGDGVQVALQLVEQSIERRSGSPDFVVSLPARAQ